MNIRDALINQAPSLAGWREAQAEIARLDAEMNVLYRALLACCDDSPELAQVFIDTEKDEQCQ